jgi:murein DD-endopeptidase MepM/ murein hydrolase activator NlpD
VGRSVALVVVFVVLCAPAGAGAYSWPLKPFNRPHPIRGAFGDPRFHLDAEGALSAFHFGVDIAAADGTKVYAVEPGYVHARRTSVAVESRSGRLFGYWHIRPRVHTGQHVRRHQLLGTIGKGWGHLHFAESFHGVYKNPLRKGALTPFVDRSTPTIAFVHLQTPSGSPVDVNRVSGAIDIAASIYEIPPRLPPAPWQVARLTPAVIWWTMSGANGVSLSPLVVDFDVGLPPNGLYNWLYAPGSYQNKANRPGSYIFWLAHGFDTADLPDGRYELTVCAENTRGHIGTTTISFVAVNGVPPTTVRTLRPERGGAVAH